MNDSFLCGSTVTEQASSKISKLQNKSVKPHQLTKQLQKAEQVSKCRYIEFHLSIDDIMIFTHPRTVHLVDPIRKLIN